MASIHRIGITAALAAATVLPASPTTAWAADITGRDFGQHVRTCAQTMGFSGDHNPGMHAGFAGWNGMTCQS
jgi:hypothetical protein